MSLRSISPGALGAALLLGACSDEFSPEQVVEVTVDSSRAADRTMMVQDTDTLVAPFLISEQPLTGAVVRWASSDPTRLELKAMPVDGGDTLLAQTRIQAIARARGPVVVTATLDQPGLEAIAVEASVTVLERWIAVTAGAGYTCGLTTEKDAYCWGSLHIGTEQSGMGLGSGLADSSGRPVPVIGGLKFDSISAGDLQTCGLTENTRQLYCWGRNVWGELGDGTIADALVPRLALGGRSFKQISTSSGLTCGVTLSPFFQGREPNPLEHNTLCWGRSSLGALGHGARFQDDVFSLPCGLSGNEEIFLCMPILRDGVTLKGDGNILLHSVSVGNGFACGIAEGPPPDLRELEAVCWGPHDAHQLGQALILDSAEVTDCADTDTTNVTRFDTIPCSFNPVRAADGFAFSALSSGGPNTCGVSAAQVYCWGGSYGGSPQRINAPPGTQLQIKSISVGGGLVGFHGSAEPRTNGDERPLACALAVGGQAFCWGDNVHGELGSGETPNPGVPIAHRDEMQMVEQEQDSLVFDAVSAGSRIATFNPPDTIAHACGLTEDGAIWCWGSNRSGALGVRGRDSASTATPSRIGEPAP